MIKVGLKINKKSLKYGSNSIILIAVVLAIVIVINLLVGMGGFKWDLTSDKKFSISAETSKIMKELDLKDVEIYGLFDDGEVSGNAGYTELINIVEKYEQFGIPVRYVDPDKDPGTIRSLDASGTKNITKGDFVVKKGSKVKRLSASSLYGQSTDYGRFSRAEALMTGAIKYVTADKTPAAYFIQGHGEPSVQQEMKQFAQALQDNNLDAKSISLVTEKSIPEDCELLIFVSPKKDLSEEEKIKVQEYIKKGGKAVFLMDPIETGDKFVNFEEVMAYYNVGMGYDIIKENDQSRHLPGDEYSIASVPESSTITEGVGTQDILLFPDTRSIKILKNSSRDYVKTTPLVKTSEKAASVDIMNQGSITEGQYNIAVAAEIEGSGKIIVFGNGKFVLDAALSSQNATYYSNDTYLVLNTIVNWMQDKKDETTISSKLIMPKTLTVTESQKNIFGIVLIGVLPLMIIAGGFVVWLRRRHL